MIEKLFLYQSKMILQLLLSILIPFILINFIQNLVKSWNSNIPLAGVPLPLIGHIHYIFGSPEVFYMKMQKLCNGKSSIGLFFGPYYTPILYDIKILSDLFKSENKFKKKSMQYNFFKQIVEKNIFSATGKSYRDTKKVLLEAVSPCNIKGYVKTFNRCSKTLVEDMKPVIGQRETNLEPKIMLCVITNIMCTLMGQRNVMQEDFNIIWNNFKKGFEIVSYRFYSAHLYPDFIFKSTKYHKQVMDAMDETRRILRRVALLRKQEYESGLKNNEQNTAFIDKFFEMNKEDGSGFAIEEIVEDVLSLFLAAIETTAATLSLSINLLAIHKNVQEKVRKECDEINVEILDIEDVRKLVYLDQVISEVMRLYPPVVIIGRELEENVELANGGHLTKGTNFLIYINAIHRNCDYYPNPCVFNPDNFLPEKIRSRPALSYIPFGIGARKCFGNVFSNLFLKTVLYHLMKSYSFDTRITEKDFRLSYDITTKNKIGVPVSITSRK